MIYRGTELQQCAANHSALSPVSILKRVERVHPELPVQVHGSIRRNWGEVTCAFVELTEGADVTEGALLDHAKSKLAGFQRPKKSLAKKS